MKKTFLVTVLITLAVAACTAFTKVQKDPGYQNLKILPKNISERQMDSVMHHFSASLNVGCDFCHTKKKQVLYSNNETWDYASDENKHKLVAREMMKMTNKLNDEHFPYSGKSEDLSTILTVTCYTCHNGQTNPETRPKKEN
jgi:hypothetical protein